MRPLPRGLACIVWLLVFSIQLTAIQAQDPGVNIGVQESHPIEPDTESVAGIPYSRVLRDPNPPYEKMFSDIRVGSYNDVKLGNGGAAFSTRLFSGPVFNLPLVSRGGRPSNAELKLGQFYLDFRYLSTSLLYSDNVNLTPSNTRDGLIGIVRLGMVGIFQVSDNLRLSTFGTLIYLPFRNKIGIAGFGIDDLFAQLENTPLARAQLAYSMEIGRWDVQVYDDFEARHQRIGIGEDYSYFDGERFDEEDRAGRYVFADRTSLPQSSSVSRNENGNIDASLIELRNIFGFTASRLLPTVTRVGFGANHSDFWYQGDRGQVPNSRDEINAFARSERENMRFKPYIWYRANRFNYENNWHHEIRGGASGPLTQNINLLGEAGYYWSDDIASDITTWRGQITHTIGPLTYHEFTYSRTVTEPIRDIRESYYYRIQQILGPYLYAEAFAAHFTFDPLTKADEYTAEDRFGVRFTSNLGLHTTARAGFAYSQIEVGNPKHDDLEAWRSRLELRYEASKDVEWRLTYQYYTASSSRASANVEENLVILTFVKYF